MKCKSCNEMLPEGAKFCPACGTAAPVVVEEPERVEPVEVAEEVAAESAAEAIEEPAPDVELVFETEIREPEIEPEPEVKAQEEPVAQMPANPYEPVGQGAPAYEPQPEPQPTVQAQTADSQQNYQAPQSNSVPPYVPVQPQVQATYAQGCVAAGLADVRESEGWLKKSMFLGLVNCVPILNFTVTGYAMNWAREIPFGGRTKLPEKVVNGKNFAYGFYYLLIALVIGLIVGVASALVGWIPLVGWVVVFAASFASYMFINLGALRTAMMQQLGEGFKFGLQWNVIKRNWTSLFCAAVVPSLVVGLIATVAMTIVMVVLTVVVAMPIAAVDSMGMDGITAVVGLTGAVLMCIVMVIALYVCCVLSALAQLVSFRAVGHWIGRYAPEWVNEAQQVNYYEAPKF